MASTSSTPTRPETQKLPMSKQVLEKMTTLGMSVEDIILMTKSDPPTKVKKFLIGQGIVSSVANSHVLYAKLREYIQAREPGIVLPTARRGRPKKNEEGEDDVVEEEDDEVIVTSSSDEESVGDVHLTDPPAIQKRTRDDHDEAIRYYDLSKKVHEAKRKIKSLTADIEALKIQLAKDEQALTAFFS